MSNYLDIELDPSLFPGFSADMLETMGHGDDTEYVYDPANPAFSPTSPTFGGGGYGDLSYPPPSQSLQFARSWLVEAEEFPASIPLPPRSLALGNAINLPHGPIPSRQADATRDEALVNSDKPKGNTGKGTGKGAGKGDENQPTNTTAVKTGRRKFTGRELLNVARAVVVLQPFLAPTKGVGEAWKGVNTYLREHSFRLDVKYTTLQAKAKALVAFKKNPACEDAKTVTPLIEGDIAVLIASALEAMETQYDAAKDKTDDAKLKLKEKSDEDRTAGNAIRDASMRARKCRLRSPSPAREDETPCKGRSSTALSATPSIELVDSDEGEGSHKRAKRRKTERRSDPSPSASANILKIMEKDMEQRQRYQRETAAAMNTYMNRAAEGQERLMGLLERLIEKE
ncbi:hypothetical protein B0H16DRAFT_1796707 [Mycena metata]|uniref:Uncharacterized protein n=1 Tax=Mycena metata TaxID=1033252 RepID=A0AAD7JI48_9AGAR|nr:hypothetical protein B0H16DRAFT_1796707 [Mycena metata]